MFDIQRRDITIPVVVLSAGNAMLASVRIGDGLFNSRAGRRNGGAAVAAALAESELPLQQLLGDGRGGWRHITRDGWDWRGGLGRKDQ